MKIKLQLLLTLLIVLATAKQASATWSLVANVAPASHTCNTTCAITVTSTGSGNVMILGIKVASTTGVISSVTGAGTWNLCASSACHATNTAPSDLGTDYAYNLNTTSGTTSLTLTMSTGLATFVWVEEYHSTLGTGILDTVGVRATSSGTANPAGVTLTLSGSNDIIAQETAFGTAPTAISSPYTDPAFASGTQSAWGGAINTASGTAPTWTAGSNQGCFSAIAIKEQAAGGVKRLRGKVITQ